MAPTGNQSTMACVVTGGAGFIGSHLVDLLLSEGHHVTVIDNLATGHLGNLAQHRGDSKFAFAEIDIAEADRLSSAFEGADWVFHLAAMADIVPSIQNPLTYHRANVDGTVAVLEAARQAGVKRFVYAASSSCYGIPDAFPTLESSPPRPMYPYALSKWVGECYVLHWAQLYAMPCLSLRLFNVYGPRHRTNGSYGAMFGVFLAQKLAGKPYTIVGDGEQTRDFTYVSDVAAAFLAAARSDLTEEVLNVGSGGCYSVNRIVELLGGDKVHIPKRPGEPDCTWADTAKITRMLGWQPRVSLEEGVSCLLREIDGWRGAPVWTPETISQATADWFRYLGRNEAFDGGGSECPNP